MRGSRQFDRAATNRRNIDAAVLLRFGQFHQHAAPLFSRAEKFRRQVAQALQHAVCAFRPFNGQHQTATDRNALAYVLRTRHRRNLNRPVNIRPMCNMVMPGLRAGSAGLAAEIVLRLTDIQPAHFKIGDYDFQQLVIAFMHARHDLLKKPLAAFIKFKFLNIGALNAANNHHIRTPRSQQRIGSGFHASDRGNNVPILLQCRLSLAFERDNKHIIGLGFGQLHRQGTGTGNQPQRFISL